MTRILLIRHGATDLMGRVLYGRMSGVHINELGFRQARSLAATLQSRYRVVEIVSSPLDRALETAACLETVLHLPVSHDEGFIELDYGQWMGLAFHDIRELESWNHYNRSRSTGVPPGGESMMQVQARAWSALEHVLHRHSDDDGAAVAIVSHGDVIRALLVLFLGMPLDHIHRFEVSPGSLSEVTFDHRYPRVLSVNQTFG